MSDTLTIQYVDPDTVLLGSNIRRDARPDDRLIESVRARGVLTPCPAVRTADGQIMLQFGSRRRAAAALTGRKLPVWVIGGEDTTRHGQIDRLFDQFDENEHREPLSAQDKAGFVQALLDFKVPLAEIRKRTGWDKDTIDAARKVAASAPVMAGPPVPDLEMAAVLAEFDAAGDTEATTALAEAVSTGRGTFKHAAQLLADTQPERFGKRDLLAQLAEAGITVLPTDDDRSLPVTAEGVRLDWHFHLNQLADPKAPDRALTEKGHAKCPGHACYLRRDGYWDSQANKHTARWTVLYLCTDPPGNGHVQRHSGKPSGKQEKDEAAREAAAALRRLVVDNNKKWRAARTVRRVWIRDTLLAKDAPKDTLVVVFEALTGRYGGEWDRGITDNMDGIGAHRMGCYLLGLADTEASGSGEMVRKALLAASPKRQQVIALGMVVGAWEAHVGDEEWRRYVDGTEEHKHVHKSASMAGHYLLLLQSWGYPLSDLEKLVAVATSEAIQATPEAGE